MRRWLCAEHCRRRSRLLDVRCWDERHSGRLPLHVLRGRLDVVAGGHRRMHRLHNASCACLWARQCHGALHAYRRRRLCELCGEYLQCERDDGALMSRMHLACGTGLRQRPLHAGMLLAARHFVRGLRKWLLLRCGDHLALVHAVFHVPGRASV